MARAQSQWLQLSSGGTVYARWQNFYNNVAITFDGATWSWLPFDADGYVEGQTGDEGEISVTLPATTPVLEILERALDGGWMAELSVYEFDSLAGAGAPLPDQTLIASAVGEVVGAAGSFATVTLQLGSSLSPVGAQVPPRTCTTRLVGVPCKL